MTATFILSLDCEGKWGMADIINASHDPITNANLVSAYRQLATLFAKYDISATYAFVATLLLKPEEYGHYEEHFNAIEAQHPEWLTHFNNAKAKDDFDGWSCPEVLDLVPENHEIGTHGFSHVPAKVVDATTFSAELALSKAFFADKGFTLQTLVYPRNDVAHLHTVTENGLVGYRARLRPKTGQLKSLFDEFNIFSKSQPQLTGGPTPIPAGYFLNWKHGLRKYIPAFITVRRWKHIINHAVKTNGVAHLWLHPHNLITAPATTPILEKLLAHVAKLQEQGKITVKTQAQYCADAT